MLAQTLHGRWAFRPGGEVLAVCWCDEHESIVALCQTFLQPRYPVVCAGEGMRKMINLAFDTMCHEELSQLMNIMLMLFDAFPLILFTLVRCRIGKVADEHRASESAASRRDRHRPSDRRSTVYCSTDRATLTADDTPPKKAQDSAALSRPPAHYGPPVTRTNITSYWLHTRASDRAQPPKYPSLQPTPSG
eukprot:scpid69715/ scgid19416/ 